ncbi:alkyldihydroxyacetonephosphate synthase, peroxisomal-like isoform X2 [Tachypleus tridentatus]|uniref:alkyldihydroxyacetonephosphate synthase, peroxisomal-like isoform X2 n=1 Tax=Tachypleus tridentatus TaxID=6853 RepID=UPI003FD0F46B
MAAERISTIYRHINGSNRIQDQTRDKHGKEISDVPKHRQEVVKWNGWGYKDSQFVRDLEQDIVSFTGTRYPLGNKKLPLFHLWAKTVLGISKEYFCKSCAEIKNEVLPTPLTNKDFLEDLKTVNISYTDDPQDRLFRSHGQTMREIFMLREGLFSRIPDLVMWPTSHDDVVQVVKMANKYNVVVIPFGGGTSVSGALECPGEERRMIVSLDTTQMNKILWVDKKNHTAHIEAGILGKDLESKLAEYGFCTGHEPDSSEFSTLGGWVATRASGMKKNIYGNIEDMLVHVRMVTSQGVVEKNCKVPRISSGPDIHHFILGSEGTLGVITEVTLKIHPLPEYKKYGSIIFPEFDAGVAYMREVAKQELKPASVRLLDNEQFIFGQALKPEAESLLTPFVDVMKKFYVTRVKGFDVTRMCVVTLLLEGKKEDVERLEKKLLLLGNKFGGLSAGEENGKRGYLLTYVIAYIRDLAFDYGVFAESFETSVPWDRNVRDRILKESESYGLAHQPFISYRVTQTYEVGACIYFYMGINTRGLPDPVHVYEELEAAARDEILACGGSVSHHHGIGKIRKRWLKQSVSSVGLGMMRAIKEYIDPNNVFANGNLMI